MSEVMSTGHTCSFQNIWTASPPLHWTRRIFLSHYIGFDWKIGIGLITSFAAREVVVSTLSTIYNVQDDGDNMVNLKEAMKNDINPKTGKPYKKKYTKGRKDGGRIGKYGGGIGAVMPRIPTGMPRVNAGGISELDYRQSGGFVPMGVKEKADDVPAMLSKNEFVMTADAVKAAGGGDVEKGAQRMYDTMKMLEGRVA